MRNFLKVSAAVAIILGVALFTWRHFAGADYGLQSAVEWATGASKLEPRQSAERRPEAVIHTVVKRVGMLLGQYRVVDERAAAKRAPPIVVTKAAPSTLPTTEVPTNAAEAAAPNKPTPAAVANEPTPTTAVNKAASAAVTTQAMATPAEKPPARAEGRFLSAAVEPAKGPEAMEPGSAPLIAPDSAKAPLVETYKIVAGDTLSSIAAKLYQDPRQWRSIAKANPGLDLRRLHPGQVIQLPRLQTASP